MSELMERLDNLRALIQTPEFLEGKGLSNEVNIRIFCYDPKMEMAVRHFTEKLVTDQSLNCVCSSPSAMTSGLQIALPSRRRKRENSLCWIR